MVTSYFKDIYPLLSKKHPNQNVYVISDHHFFHKNIIKYQRNDFDSLEEMHSYIIKKHNEVVKDEDVVFFLGDFSFKNKEMEHILKLMNGHKYLLFGNHDSKSVIRIYEELGFEGIFLTPVSFQNNYLSHQPLCEQENYDLFFSLLIKEFKQNTFVNYHGHIHNEQINDAKFINVCCEVQNYKPLLIGKTGEYKKDEKTNFINTNYFSEALLYLRDKNNINVSLILADYIYSMMLDAITIKKDKFVVYGSYPLYKKYNYISNFSDLDIGILYDSSLSKKKNIGVLKQMSDDVYTALLSTNNIHPSYLKRIANISIVETIYSNGQGFKHHGYYDSNLVMADIYKSEDFISYSSCTVLEKLLSSNHRDILETFNFPKYEAQFLTENGDMANLILQVLFQQGFPEKKAMALKKLLFIYRLKKQNVNIDILEDTLERFLIRNILFFYYTNRKNEIDSIRESYIDMHYLMDNIPITLKNVLEEILINPNSTFNHIFEEMVNTNFNNIPEIANELIIQKKKF